MGSEDREKWDRQHAARIASEDPSPFLREISATGRWSSCPGRALDVATGTGRNAFFLAKKGFCVDAVDISDAALQTARSRASEKGLSINWTQADLDRFEFPDAAYDLVLNVNFLQRLLIPKLKSALRLGGHMIFETYIVDQRVLGHPRNPAYLLGHNELLRLFDDFRVLFYREGKWTDGGRESFRAGLLAQKVR